MTTYPLPTLACTLDETGISGPPYQDILNSLVASAQSIFGADVVLTPDSQDGQLLAIFAQAMFDGNQGDIATYNSYSPATAQGVALSSTVRLNAMRRQSASFSVATVTLVGTVGVNLVNCVVADTAVPPAHQWSLPPLVVFPASGTIDVTATCDDAGAVQAGPGTLTVKVTPTVGWASATNVLAATPGNPVESDAQLRVRQRQTTAQPANTVLDGIVGAVGQVPGVTEVYGFQNKTNTTDSNGIPGHMISLVVRGGDVTAVATAINNKIPPGVGTYGTTSVVVFDARGVPDVINLFVLAFTTIYVEVTLKALTGYSATTGVEIAASVAASISGLSGGEEVYLNRLYAPANLSGAVAEAVTQLTSQQLAVLQSTYNVTLIRIGYSPGGGLGTADLPITFNHQAFCDPLADVVLVVT